MVIIKENIIKSKGFAILFAVTLSAILLAIALGVTNIAVKELKFATSAQFTNEAFFAADTGMECALLNDTSGGFFQSDGSNPMECSGRVFFPIGNSPYWNFYVPALGQSSQNCAQVTVDKSGSETEIISKGYNFGNPDAGAQTCGPLPSSVERELKITY